MSKLKADKSCIDCCNLSEDGPDGYCKVADQPSVEQFCADPETLVISDMSRCPGFREDV